MSLSINSNIEAFNAHRNLALTSLRLSKSMEKLSSGFRINRASDDAAGLGISERMRSQIGGIAQAQRNAQDGISMVQTAEGSMEEMHSILHRIRDLAVQYNNGTYSTVDKQSMVAEVAQLSSELTRMVGAASFNGIPLLASAAGAPLATLQVGANSGEILVVPGVDVATSLGSEVSRFASADPTTVTQINIGNIDTAISNLANNRATFGAVQNRLEHTINSLSSYQENLISAESRIRDVDMAQEITNMTRLQILQQSGTAMLAQANSMKSSILSLLQ